MVSKNARKLSPEVERRLAAIEGMTLQQVQAALGKCMADLSKGNVTAYEGYRLRRAADKRIKVLTAGVANPRSVATH